MNEGSVFFFNYISCAEANFSQGRCRGLAESPCRWRVNRPSGELVVDSFQLCSGYKAKQKKVSPSTNPTDRVLKGRADTFFDFASDTLWRRSVRGSAWPVASLIATAREKSNGKKSSKGPREGDLDCDPGFWAVIQVREEMCDAVLDRCKAISVGCSKSFIYSLLATSCFNFETDMSVLFYFFGWFVLAQLISCFSSTGRPMAADEKQLSSSRAPRTRSLFLQRKSSARERGCHLALSVAGCAWR